MTNPIADERVSTLDLRELVRCYELETIEAPFRLQVLSCLRELAKIREAASKGGSVKGTTKLRGDSSYYKRIRAMRKTS